MIISASRRTDIPTWYFQWFLNRLREGYVLVQNPYNEKQLRRVSLARDDVDAIVFWTKNPLPMFNDLDALCSYPFMFQFSITGYGRDMEPHIPDKKAQIIPAFQRLSRQIGMGGMSWRYDPIAFYEGYDMAYHERAFAFIAGALEGYTDTVVISFVDLYKNLRGKGFVEPHLDQMLELCRDLSKIAESRGMKIQSCAEEADLSPAGVARGACLDRERIEAFLGRPIKGKKDAGQRNFCLCTQSVDIGAYHSCPSGCRYCYANWGIKRIEGNRAKYDPDSPLLCAKIPPGEEMAGR